MLGNRKNREERAEGGTAIIGMRAGVAAAEQRRVEQQQQG